MFPTMSTPKDFNAEKTFTDLDEDILSISEFIKTYNTYADIAIPKYEEYSIMERDSTNEAVQAHNALVIYCIHHMSYYYRTLMTQHKAELSYYAWLSFLFISDWEYTCLALEEMPMPLLEQFMFNDVALRESFMRTAELKELVVPLKNRSEAFFTEHDNEELEAVLSKMFQESKS